MHRGILLRERSPIVRFKCNYTRPDKVYMSEMLVIRASSETQQIVSQYIHIIVLWTLWKHYVFRKSWIPMEAVVTNGSSSNSS